MSETLPGFEDPTTPSGSPVFTAYANAVEALRASGVLRVEHEGLAANLLKLGAVIDTERKGYAIAHATAQAHDIMKTLLDLVPAETGDEFTDLMRRLELVHPIPPTPPTQ